jgi:hypothetical protein
MVVIDCNIKKWNLILNHEINLLRDVYNNSNWHKHQHGCKGGQISLRMYLSNIVNIYKSLKFKNLKFKNSYKIMTLVLYFKQKTSNIFLQSLAHIFNHHFFPCSKISC